MLSKWCLSEGSAMCSHSITDVTSTWPTEAVKSDGSELFFIKNWIFNQNCLFNDRSEAIVGSRCRKIIIIKFLSEWRAHFVWAHIAPFTNLLSMTSTSGTWKMINFNWFLLDSMKHQFAQLLMARMMPLRLGVIKTFMISHSHSLSGAFDVN